MSRQDLWWAVLIVVGCTLGALLATHPEVVRAFGGPTDVVVTRLGV